MTDDELVTVLVFCTLCGNRSSTNVSTGEKADTVFRVDRGEAERMRAELAERSTCIYCGAPMGLKILEPPEDRFEE